MRTEKDQRAGGWWALAGVSPNTTASFKSAMNDFYNSNVFVKTPYFSHNPTHQGAFRVVEREEEEGRRLCTA